MTDLPTDLVTIPTTPYSERPDSLPLDIEECRTALWLCKGNVTQAAEMLKVRSARLRSFVNASAYLRREMEEATERLKDKAMSVIEDALHGPPERADSMARYVMTNLGHDRGFGNKVSVKTLPNGGPTIFAWDDGTILNPSETRRNAETIDG